MHIHILGICGTFMGGLALMARELGHQVSGADHNVYPPMSTMLQESGIEVMRGYDALPQGPQPDCVVIGNALSRGTAVVEQVLELGLPYTSGPQWLSEHLLKDRWVLAVAGTHGKTTTTSMLAWILEYAGLQPGFLIGGVPLNFGVSARLGDSPFFVIEADEYDTAFFDKRSKFVHYRPRTLVLNNLEFDHADIFPDLAAIQRQFHHLVRTVPGQGLIIAPHDDKNIQDVLKMGCWTPVEGLNDAQTWHRDAADGGARIKFADRDYGQLDWSLVGEYNEQNALAAIAAARHAGVPAEQAVKALREFKNVKRRLEVRGVVGGVTVYDDFAHHPTAIEATVKALRGHIDHGRIFAVLEPRSNTMRMGVHQATLAHALRDADRSWLFQPAGLEWNLGEALSELGNRSAVFDNVQSIIDALLSSAQPGDHILIMSNGGFDNVHSRLLEALDSHAKSDSPTAGQGQ